MLLELREYVSSWPGTYVHYATNLLEKMGVQSFVMQAVRELSGRLIICASMNVHEQMQGPTPAQACVGHFGWVGREGASLQ